MVLLGLAAAAVGVVVVLRPFTSLTVLVILVAAGLVISGASSLARWHRQRRPWPDLIIGVVSIIAGIAVAVWPGITTEVLANLVGLAMVLVGVLDIAGGIRGTADDPLTAVLGGLATAVVGVLAYAWPDVTVLVVAVVFGGRLVLHGLVVAWAAWRDRDGCHAPAPARRVGRAWRVTGSILALVLALALAGLSVWLNGDRAVVDAFYTPPAEVPATSGALMRAEPFRSSVPDSAEAWRILYTTTRDEGIPAVASALVVAPRDRTDEPAPVVAWAHGTTGVARPCAPSVFANPFEAGSFYVLDDVIDHGWVLVASDYIGLGTPGPHPYLIGEGEARSVLDSVRAARQLDEVSLSDQTVVWGHSQGGHAALWTGVVAPAYAPDVPLAGVAALAPASDLVGLVRTLPQVTGGSIFATYALSAYSAAYADISLADYVVPTGRPTFDATANRCLGDRSILVSALTSIVTGASLFSGDLTAGPAGARLAENTPAAPIDAPLLIAQGLSDSLVSPEVQAGYVAARCQAGQQLEYRTYPGLDHVPLVEANSPLVPDLVAWTEARLAGTPPPSTC
jgi:uncharacterized membrane protein HdeD (DUF308 family)/alpha-beta hydrolase superfamily lysophospholipase